jgi:septal ring factor EnvC (AmiA/AmiB activator)
MRDIQSKHLPRREQIDFILLALNGKKVGFEEVIKMIDEMAATLAEEQKDDDEKKDKCSDDFDMADDKKKSLEHDLSDLETSMNEAEEKIGAFKADIESLQASIAKLDKSVAEATANRKAEHEEFEALLASDTAAKELLNFAKNRLNKFYNPKLYKAPPKRELSDADRAVLAGGGELDTTPPPGGIAGTGITVLADVSEHDQQEAAPPPPPETWGAYKKSGESTGVIAMIDLLVKDLDKELTVATAEEKNAQADYETFMEDSAQRRAAESKSLAQQQGALAEGEATFEDFKASDAATKKELAATNKFIAALHADCDWLLKYFDTRKEARASEIDSLQKAQAVLSGADYSFVQTKAVRGHLRG